MPRTMRLAAEHADIWSAFATSSSQPEAFQDLVRQFVAICEEAGRDPASVGKSIGVIVAPPGKDPSGVFAGEDSIKGSGEQIIDAFGRLGEIGFTRIEVMAAGDVDETIEGLAPLVAELSSSP